MPFLATEWITGKRIIIVFFERIHHFDNDNALRRVRWPERWFDDVGCA